MHVFVIAPIPYSFLHQRPQKLADLLRRNGVRVTYVEPSGIREYLRGIRQGLLRALWITACDHLAALLTLAVRSFRVRRRDDVPPDHLILPLIIPHNKFPSRLLECINAQVYRRALLRHVPVTVETTAMIHNPFWGRVLRPGDFARIVYDCMDAIQLYAGNAPVDRFRLYESRLVSLASAAAASAQALEQDLRERYPALPVVRIPNGVDARWFEERAAHDPEPDALRPIPRPRIGYLGAMYGWVDYALIAGTARLCPDLSFVMIGPADTSAHTGDLDGIPNVTVLERQPYERVPACIRSFDVCLIPFISGEVAATTNPVKLYEYFAVGRPVVATPIAELAPYVDEQLVYQASDARTFGEACRAALKEPEDGRVERRKLVARRHSWDDHAGRMLALLREGS